MAETVDEHRELCSDKQKTIEKAVNFYLDSEQATIVSGLETADTAIQRELFIRVYKWIIVLSVQINAV